MYSFIEEINDYISSRGIPFKNINISSSYFPKYFNEAVLRELRNTAGGKWVDYSIENYELIYEDNRLQLVARSKNNHTVLAIFNKNLWFSIKEPSKKLFETNITTLATYLENKELEKIYQYIDSRGLTGRYVISPVSIDEALKETAKKCISYIEYLNNEYLKQLAETEKEEREMKSVSLKYNSPEVSTGMVKTYEKKGGVSRERVNSILPLDERVSILESYDYMYVGYAYSNDFCENDNRDREIAYLNYLYNLGHNKYALVMEPYSGTSYTKIMIFDSEEEITKEMFSGLIKDTLELSYDDISLRTNIIRTNHTTVDTFSNLIDYIVKNSNTCTLLNGYTRKKIEGLKR